MDGVGSLPSQVKYDFDVGWSVNDGQIKRKVICQPD